MSISEELFHQLLVHIKRCVTLPFAQPYFITCINTAPKHTFLLQQESVTAIYVSQPQNSCHLSHALLGLGMPRTRASSTRTERRTGPPATSAPRLSPSARSHERNRAAHPPRGSGRQAQGSPRSRRCGQTPRRGGPYPGAYAGPGAGGTTLPRAGKVAAARAAVVLHGAKRPRLGPGSAGGRGSRRARGRARRCGAGQCSHLGGAAGLQHVLLHRHGPARLPAAPRARRAGDGGGWAGPGLGERRRRRRRRRRQRRRRRGGRGSPSHRQAGGPPRRAAAMGQSRSAQAPPSLPARPAAAAQRARSAASPPAPPSALPPRLPAAAPPRAPASPKPRCPCSGRPPRGCLAGGTAGSACLHLGGGARALPRGTARPGPAWPKAAERPRCPPGLDGVSASGLRFPRPGAEGSGSCRSPANARGRTGSVQGLAAAVPTCYRRLPDQRLLGGRCPDTGPEDAPRLPRNV